MQTVGVISQHMEVVIEGGRVGVNRQSQSRLSLIETQPQRLKLLIYFQSAEKVILILNRKAWNTWPTRTSTW